MERLSQRIESEKADIVSKTILASYGISRNYLVSLLSAWFEDCYYAVSFVCKRRGAILVYSRETKKAR